MKAIQTYLQAHRLQLFVAALICAGLAFGMIDPAAALVGGIMLETEPIDLKAIYAATQKAFEAMKEKNTELSSRVLYLEQRGAYRPGGGGGGNEAGAGAIVKAIGESEQFKAMQSGLLKECRISLPPGAFNTKANIVGALPGSIGPLGAPDRSPDIVAASMRRLTVRGLLPSLPTEAAATQYTRLLAFTNNAAIQGVGTSPPEVEGALKAQSNMTFELVTAPVVTVATWVAASNQVLNDMPSLERFIETWLTYGLALVEEDELLNGAGTGVHLPGLLTLASQFNRSHTSQTKLDKLRAAITQLQLAFHVPTGIVLNPTDWEGIELTKNTLGDYLEVTLTDANGNPVAWRCPVVPTVAIAAGTFLVGDFQSALVRDRQQATIEISNSHADFFARNLLAIRAEQREGLEIHRPTGFVTGTF